MLILFLSSLILAATLSTTDATTQCRNEKFGRKICPLESNPFITRVVNGEIFVGVADALHVYQPDLILSQVVDLSSDNATRDKCSSSDGLGNNLASCRNFIRTIAVDPTDSEKVLVCGTNAFFPLCNVHQASNISNFNNLTSPTEADEGYSPLSSGPIVSILANNGRFFSATGGLNFITLLRMSMNPLGGDAAISVQSVNNDNWLDNAEFVSVHEHGDYVYFFMTETAVEVRTFQDQPRYSRAIRICKTDMGLIDEATNVRRFLTFQKARITCSVEDFDYDAIKSTFLYEREDSAVLYATFNAHKNGPAGGAICKFAFDENVDDGFIEVFQHNSYLVQTDGTYTSTTGTGNFACPGTSRPMDEVDYFLKTEQIVQQPLFVSDSEFLDKIATETIQYGSDSQEIVYFTNLQGDIKQVVLSGETYEHTLYESTDDEQVEDLILEQGSNNERSIIAGIQGAIALIPRGQCSKYTCFDCFDSRDAYCGWDTVSGTCKNKLTHSTTLIQSFSASEEVIVAQCGQRPPTSETTDENPSVPCLPKATTAPGNIGVTTEKDEEEVDCSTNVVATPVKTEGLTLGGGGNVSIAAIVGAAVGAFLVGVPIGGLVCVLFYSKLVNRKKNKDEKGPSPETPTELTVVSTVPKVNNESITKPDNSSKESSLSVDKTDLSTPTLKPAPPPRYILQKPNGVGQSNGGIQNNTNAPLPPTVPIVTTPPPPTVPSEYETPTQSTGKKMSSSSTLPAFRPTSSRALAFNRQQTLPEVSEDDNAFVDNDVVTPLRDFHHHPGTMHNSLPRMKNKNRANGVARKQVPGYKTPRGRTESTTWLRQRSESLSSDISSNTSPLQSPISDV